MPHCIYSVLHHVYGYGLNTYSLTKLIVSLFYDLLVEWLDFMALNTLSKQLPLVLTGEFAHYLNNHQLL